MTTIGVVFKEGFSNQVYSYKADFTVSKGDFVVVDSPHGGYKLAEVQIVEAVERSKATKYAVCRVDDSQYKARIEKEKRAVELEKLIEKKLEALEKKQRYALLASDPSAAALVAELNSISI